MNAFTVAIRRPAGTILLTVGVLLLGILAYSKLPIAALPSVDRPTLQVFAPLPGGSPATVASSVAQPLEARFGLIPGIVEMTSISTTGGVNIVLQFDINVNIDDAAGEVQAAINAAEPELPRGQAWPPVYWKANPADAPVMALAMTSDILPGGDVYETADAIVSAKLSELPGVARVLINGGERGAVRVQVSPARIAAMGVSLETIRNSINAASQDLPKGAIERDGQRLTLDANDQITKAADYRKIPVALRDGTPIRLGDIANVSESVINSKLAGWYNAKPAVVLFVFKQPNANVVATVDAIKAVLPNVQKLLPAAIKLNAVYDRTLLIRSAVADVELTIAIAIGLAVMVTALFMRRLWATVIPGLTIPVTLAGTLVVMAVCGYSLDNLSLMALTIGVGFAVDDAVIIVESILRRMAEGETARGAAIAAIRQLTFTIISITVALVSALIPVLFMPDVAGRYFHEFGVTLVATIVISALVCLLVSPVLCSRLLARRDGAHQEPEEWRLDHWLGALYGRTLASALRYPALVVLVALLASVASGWLYLHVPKGFMPTQDTGVVYARTITASNISFDAMNDMQRRVGQIILADPAVSGTLSYIGEGNGVALSTGQLVIALKPLDQRKLPVGVVIARLQKSLADVQGVRTFFAPLQDLNIGTQSSTARYQYTIWGSRPEQVLAAGENMLKRISTLPGITNTIGDWESQGLGAGLNIDRVRAAAAGVSPVDIDNTLYDAFGQREVNTLLLPTNYSHVILEIDPESQIDPAAFNQLYVQSANGAQVPLSSITMPTVRAHAAMWAHHNDQFPSVTISFDVKPGTSIGTAIQRIQAAQMLPGDVHSSFKGEAAAAAGVAGTQLVLLAVAIAAIYICLGVLYESFMHPLTILSTLPSALLGELLALKVTGMELTLISSVACILAVGMVMKNAIMIVDIALEATRRSGMDALEAVTLAARRRVRPIMMTALVSILGAIPLALGKGPGYELRQSVGITIIGGIAVAQFFTIYSTPAVFLILERAGRLARRRLLRQAGDRVTADGSD